MPQVIEQEMVATYDHPVVGNYRGLANPIKFSATPAATPFASPTFVQHTEAILRSEGYSSDEIDELDEAGAVMRHQAAESV